MVFLQTAQNQIRRRRIQMSRRILIRVLTVFNYRICPNYRTYPYKRAVNEFCSFQNTARVLFVYFSIETNVVVLI